jgi:hypothetical protein
MNETQIYNELFDSCVLFILTHPEWDVKDVVRFSKEYLFGQQHPQICAG